MVETSDILEKLPKKTPLWAVGVVSIIVSVVLSISSIYLIAKDDIRARISWSEKSQDSKESVRAGQEAKALDGVLLMVNSNMILMAELNKALGISQLQTSSLASRVSELEVVVGHLKENLSTCENNLKNCLAKSNQGK